MNCSRLVTKAAYDLRQGGFTARTITVKLRDKDFKTRSARRTLDTPVVADRVIMEVARELLPEAAPRAARAGAVDRCGAFFAGPRMSTPIS